MFILRDGEDIKGCFNSKALVLTILRTEYECDKEIAFEANNATIEQLKDKIKKLETEIDNLPESNLHSIPLRQEITQLNHLISACQAKIKEFSKNSSDFNLSQLLDFYDYDLEEHELITEA